MSEQHIPDENQPELIRPRKLALPWIGGALLGMGVTLTGLHLADSWSDGKQEKVYLGVECPNRGDILALTGVETDRNKIEIACNGEGGELRPPETIEILSDKKDAVLTISFEPFSSIDPNVKITPNASTTSVQITDAPFFSGEFSPSLTPENPNS